MADTETAAAAATNPADVSMTESSDLQAKATSANGPADAKSGEKAAGDSESKSKSDDAGEEKWELNGKKDERRGGRGERNDRGDRNDRPNDRRGGQRGRGRGRGGFQNNRKCVAHALLAMLSTDSTEQAQRRVRQLARD
jgi:lupus La protein